MGKFSTKIFSDATIGELSAWLVIFIAFGYPVSVSIPVFLGLASSTPINVTFRGLYLGVSIFLILATAFRSNSSKLYIGSYFLIGFWIFYTFRLLYDINVKDLLPALNSKFYIYSFAFGNGLIPVLAILLSGKYVNLNTIFKKLFIFLSLGNCLTIFLLLKITNFSPDLFAARASLTLDAAGGKKINVLNPILLGYYGEVLALLSIGKLLVGRKVKFFKRVILYLGMSLGLLNLVLGASRGPMISFFLILLIVLAFHIKVANKSTIYILKATFFLAVLSYFVSTTLAPLLAETSMVRRLEKMIALQENVEGVSLDTRDSNFASAWQQFKDNPVLGDQYLLTHKSYPHNVYLEALMATGLYGGFFFYGFLFFLIRKMIQSWRFYTFEIFVVFISVMTTILGHATSGNLYAGVAFWALVSFFSTLNIKKHARLSSYRIIHV